MELAASDAKEIQDAADAPEVVPILLSDLDVQAGAAGLVRHAAFGIEVSTYEGR
ncbi:MAG: hypothetical protein QN159_14245 [Armatimonadota bacterium]|nr:hypothetical protein [Armatimonadota bacterium]